MCFLRSNVQCPFIPICLYLVLNLGNYFSIIRPYIYLVQLTSETPLSNLEVIRCSICFPCEHRNNVTVSSCDRMAVIREQNGPSHLKSAT